MKKKKPQGSLTTINKWSNIHTNRLPEEKEGLKKSIWRNDSWKFPKCVKTHAYRVKKLDEPLIGQTQRNSCQHTLWSNL